MGAALFDFEPDFPSERTMTRFRDLTGPLTPDAMAREYYENPEATVRARASFGARCRT